MPWGTQLELGGLTQLWAQSRLSGTQRPSPHPPCLLAVLVGALRVQMHPLWGTGRVRAEGDSSHVQWEPTAGPAPNSLPSLHLSGGEAREHWYLQCDGAQSIGTIRNRPQGSGRVSRAGEEEPGAEPLPL